MRMKWRYLGNKFDWLVSSVSHYVQIAPDNIRFMTSSLPTLNFLLKFLLDWKQFQTFFMSIEYVTKNEGIVWEVVTWKGF